LSRQIIPDTDAESIGVLGDVVPDRTTPPAGDAMLVRSDRDAKVRVLGEGPEREAARGALRLPLLGWHGDDQAPVRLREEVHERVVDQTQRRSLPGLRVESARHRARRAPSRDHRGGWVEHAGGCLRPVEGGHRQLAVRRRSWAGTTSGTRACCSLVRFSWSRIDRITWATSAPWSSASFTRRSSTPALSAAAAYFARS